MDKAAHFALVPIQYTIPFSSKSCWCLKMKLWPSLSFLTKMNEDLSKSYHCLATWGKRGDKVMIFSPMPVGIQLCKYGIMEEIKQKSFPTILSRYCSSDSTVASGSIFSILPVRSIRAVSPGARSKRKRNLLVRI